MYRCKCHTVLHNHTLPVVLATHATLNNRHAHTYHTACRTPPQHTRTHMRPGSTAYTSCRMHAQGRAALVLHCHPSSAQAAMHCGYEVEPYRLRKTGKLAAVAAGRAGRSHLCMLAQLCFDTFCRAGMSCSAPSTAQMTERAACRLVGLTHGAGL
jgi:hypothetical protein